MTGKADSRKPAPPAAILDMERHLPYRLARLSNLIRQTTSDVYLKSAGMTGREWRVLGMIGLRGPLSAAETAELTGMDRATITRSVDRLESSGFVERGKDPRDRRRIVLEVTPRGRRKCDQIIPLLEEDGRYYEAALSASEVRQLLNVIGRLEDLARERHRRLLGSRRGGGKARRAPQGD
ncbi:MAG: MarR family winged helix-turn-helix transcriptional regulator [Pseudomonadales bacterium]